MQTQTAYTVKADKNTKRPFEDVALKLQGSNLLLFRLLACGKFLSQLLVSRCVSLSLPPSVLLLLN